MNPRVTALIPTYNRAYAIGQAVDCVLGQTCSNCNTLVGGDGSTNAAPDLVAGRYGSNPKDPWKIELQVAFLEIASILSRRGTDDQFTHRSCHPMIGREHRQDTSSGHRSRTRSHQPAHKHDPKKLAAVCSNPRFAKFLQTVHRKLTSHDAD